MVASAFACAGWAVVIWRCWPWGTRWQQMHRALRLLTLFAVAQIGLVEIVAVLSYVGLAANLPGAKVSVWYWYSGSYAGLVLGCTVLLWSSGCQLALLFHWPLYRLAYHHRCPGCGYDLRGTATRICPECGAERRWLDLTVIDETDARQDDR